jgi:hypothetical protein
MYAVLQSQEYCEPLKSVVNIILLVRESANLKFGIQSPISRKNSENLLRIYFLKIEVPSSAGGNSSFELHSQSMEERAATITSMTTRACAPD